MARKVSWHPDTIEELRKIEPAVARRLARLVSERLARADFPDGLLHRTVGRWRLYFFVQGRNAVVYRIRPLEENE